MVQRGNTNADEKGSANTMAPNSLVFIKMIVQPSRSAKAENTEGRSLLSALKIRSPDKEQWSGL